MIFILYLYLITYKANTSNHIQIKSYITKHNMVQAALLQAFLFRRVRRYEEGIFQMIISMVFHTIRDNEDLRDAVYLWFENNDYCLERYGHISLWNTVNVTDMSKLFLNRHTFNVCLNYWNVSNVKTMKSMFESAIEYNQPMDKWDTSKVEDMSFMLFSTDDFNQPLNTWNVSKVTKMVEMFAYALSFRQQIDTWQISEDTDVTDMILQPYY